MPAPRRWVIGLTGGIATGKSTVIRALRRRGVTVIDADRIAQEVVRPGHPVWRKLRRAFGTRCFSSRGTLNRRRLGEWVFQHPAQRRVLERLTHPTIIGRIRSQLQRARGIVILDAPLLFEARLTPLVDQVVVVWAPLATQLDRLQRRNRLSRQAALQRIRAQWPLVRKRRLADVVLNNRGPSRDLYRQLDTFWKSLAKKH